jgi:alpha-beta hydrolase superfamily lysophospholipase
MLSAALDDRLRGARRFVVSSPALRTRVAVSEWKKALGNVSSRVLPRLSMSNEVDAATLSHIPEIVTAYRSDPLVHPKITSRMYTEWQKASADILRRAGQIKLPFLIFAGVDDQLIDPAGSEELHRRAPAKSELHLLAGRYHESLNDIGRNEVYDLVSGWLGAS